MRTTLNLTTRIEYVNGSIRVEVTEEELREHSRRAAVLTDALAKHPLFVLRALRAILVAREHDPVGKAYQKLLVALLPALAKPEHTVNGKADLTLVANWLKANPVTVSSNESAPPLEVLKASVKLI